MSYVRSLVEDLELGPDELKRHVGVARPEDITTSVHASEAIEALRRLHEERQPPSAKQRRCIDDLVKRADSKRRGRRPWSGSTPSTT